MTAFTQNKLFDLKSIEATKLWDPKKSENHNGSEEKNESKTEQDTQTANSQNDALLRALYERIIVLEQLSREQSLKIDKLTAQLNRTSSSISEMDARNSGGILVWNITEFQSKVQAMHSSPNVMYYSPNFYTSPLGYRFCARINISPKARERNLISLHMHMMHSENDYHLDWPFRGCIKIWMIHQEASLTRVDKIMSNETVLAFQRPDQKVCPRGFGFIEYANIHDIHKNGFVCNDTLTIKIHISIV